MHGMLRINPAEKFERCYPTSSRPRIILSLMILSTLLPKSLFKYSQIITGSYRCCANSWRWRSPLKVQISTCTKRGPINPQYLLSNHCDHFQKQSLCTLLCWHSYELLLLCRCASILLFPRLVCLCCSSVSCCPQRGPCCCEDSTHAACSIMMLSIPPPPCDTSSTNLRH